jgi:hypothetical protein
MSVLALMGYTFIIQSIVTGELGYVPYEALIAFALGVGLSLVVGIGYLLVVPPFWFTNVRAYLSRSDVPSRVSTSIRAPLKVSA